MKLVPFLKTVFFTILKIEQYISSSPTNDSLLNPDWVQQHLGTRRNYPSERFQLGIDNITGDYNVEQIHLLVRHGTRYPVTSGIDAVTHALKKLSESNNTDKVGWTKTYKHSYVMRRQGQLEPQGQIELFDMGRRLATRYPTFFNSVIDDGIVIGGDSLLQLSASWSSRTLQSGQAFSVGAFQGQGPLLGESKIMAVPIYSLEQGRDTLIAYLKACPRWKKEAKQRASIILDPIYEKYITPIAQRLSGVLGLEVNVDDVKAIHNACTSEVSLYRRTDTFCCVFTKQDILTMEYMDDLKHYFLYSYGMDQFNGKVGCALGKHIMGHIQSMVNGDEDAVRLDVKFGHTQTLQPFRTLLELYKEELSINSTEAEIKNRIYRMSEFGYFGNNFMIQLLSHKRKTKEYYVRLLDNEVPIHVSECKSTICTLQEFYSFISTKLNCNFTSYCKV